MKIPAPERSLSESTAADELPLAAELGGRIRRAREDKKLSQSVLGAVLGYKTSTISAFETGARRLRVEDLAKLCVALDKEPEFFLRTQEIREAHRRPIGLTLRAEVAGLPHQALSDSITAFLDSVEHGSLPASRVPDFHYLKPHGAARELLDRCRIGGPPVRLSAVAKQLRVPVLEWEFPDSLSAMIVEVDDGDYVIGVNRHHGQNRKRFSTAHELGHALLRHRAGHYLEFFDTSLGEPPNYRVADEREANNFAAALLMDERWLREDWARDQRDVPTLAGRYQVSEEAMSFRLMNLGLHER